MFSQKRDFLDADDQLQQEIVDNINTTWYTKLLTLKTEHHRAKRLHELLVQSQTEEHELPNSLFNLVMQGDLDGVKTKLILERKLGKGADVNLVLRTDAAGGNVIHAAYLYEQYQIGRWFVEHYPTLAILPYSDECKEGMAIDSDDMPYAGENILHMTIVRKNITETRWLLDFYKEHKDSVKDGLETLLLANARGKFFSLGGEFYCGCYPLHFAACSNDAEMFDLILAYASALGYNLDNIVDRSNCRLEKTGPRIGSNVIFMRDRHGNNCLHLAVIHKLKEIYSHIKSTALKLLEKEIRLSRAEILTLALDYKKSDWETHHVIPLKPLPQEVGFVEGYCPEETEIIAPRDQLSAEAFNVWLREASQKKFQERMELVLNEDFHSPLTLCGASEEESGKKEMLSFLLTQMRTERWTYGPVKCALIGLEGVEYPYYIENYEHGPRPIPYSAKKKCTDSLNGFALPTQMNQRKYLKFRKSLLLNGKGLDSKSSSFGLCTTCSSLWSLHSLLYSTMLRPVNSIMGILW